jgi:uncharacterized membrane protein
MSNDDAVLFTAVYDDERLALSDLQAFEDLHDAEVIGHYDAAVIDRHDGKPHIVKRADRPRVRVIPELLGGGTLPRKELKEAADTLEQGQCALVVVGEPTLDKAFDKAVTRAATTAKRTFDTTTDELAAALTASVRT